ncbi:BTE_collapsed_G0004240.mRNA.1.CDS.1 [Saccharomyces cerevisiae]|nr:BTE_collapsed_G0004240.mRNA.1.CDS.1 [Saccharomyces cerevisiae]
MRKTNKRLCMLSKIAKNTVLMPAQEGILCKNRPHLFQVRIGHRRQYLLQMNLKSRMVCKENKSNHDLRELSVRILNAKKFPLRTKNNRKLGNRLTTNMCTIPIYNGLKIPKFLHLLAKVRAHVQEIKQDHQSNCY